MAATVHVTGSAASAAVIPVGPFGFRVAEFLGAGTRNRVIDPDLAVKEAFSMAADVVVLAMWRPCPSLCELADQLSYSTGRPWLPVVAEPAAIQVGPLVRAPAAPCYRCYARRRAQHDSHHDATIALHNAFDRDPQLGPAGYLPHQARLAAGTATNLIGTALASEAAGADTFVIAISLPNCVPSASTVVPCHDCTRCRGSRTREPCGTDVLLRVAAGMRQAARAG